MGFTTPISEKPHEFSGLTTPAVGDNLVPGNAHASGLVRLAEIGHVRLLSPEMSFQQHEEIENHQSTN
jgi:hypothetical protein